MRSTAIMLSLALAACGSDSDVQPGDAGASDIVAPGRDSVGAADADPDADAALGDTATGDTSLHDATTTDTTPPVIECVEPTQCGQTGVIGDSVVITNAGAFDDANAWVAGYRGSDAIVRVARWSDAGGASLGQVEFEAFPVWVERIAPNIAYVGAVSTADGLRDVIAIVDSTSGTAELREFVDAPEFNASGVPCRGGDLLLSWSSEGYRVADASDPLAPVISGLVPVPGNDERRFCALRDDRAYLIGMAPNDGVGPSYSPVLRAIDVSNPNAPSELGSVQLANVDTPGNGLFMEMLDQEHLLTVGQHGRDIEVVVHGVGDPANMQVLGSVAWDGLEVLDVAVDGQTAYVFTLTRLVTVSLADSANPAVVTTIPWSPGEHTVATKVRDGTLTLLAADAILRGPVQESVAGLERLPLGFRSFGLSLDIAFVDTVAFISLTDGGIAAFETCGDGRPVWRTTVLESARIDDLVASGPHMAGADRTSGQIHILDISTPDEPTPVGTVDETPARFEIAGDTLVVLDDEEDLALYDLVTFSGEPATAVPVRGLLSQPPPEGWEEEALQERLHVTAHDGRLFLLAIIRTGEAEAEFIELDVSDPSAPVVVTSSPVPIIEDIPTHFTVTDTTAYLANGQFIFGLDRSNPSGQARMWDFEDSTDDTTPHITDDRVVLANGSRLTISEFGEGTLEESAVIVTDVYGLKEVRVSGNRAVAIAGAVTAAEFEIVCQ